MENASICVVTKIERRKKKNKKERKIASCQSTWIYKRHNIMLKAILNYGVPASDCNAQKVRNDKIVKVFD